jgi:glucokinase
MIMANRIQPGNQRPAIGIDLGGTKIAGALVNRRGDIVATTRRPTEPARGSEAVLDSLAASITELLEQAEGEVAGVGVGCPGLIDPVSGTVIKATSLGWSNLRLLAGL